MVDGERNTVTGDRPDLHTRTEREREGGDRPGLHRERVWGGGGGERQTHTHTQTGTRQACIEKTLIFNDSSVRSIWAYLTASPCYTTNTTKHDYTTNR